MGRGFRYSIIILCVTLLMEGCGELTPPAERREEIGFYTVRAGDTLYSIAWVYGIDHRELASWNNIPPPYLIHPGQKLSLTPPVAKQTPPTSYRSADNSPKKPVAAPSKPAKPVPKNRAHTSPSPKGERPKPHGSNTSKNVGDEKKLRTSSLFGVENAGSATTNRGWHWPTNGTVVNRFDPDSGKKGIDITGVSGQAIFSAAAGDVVYSGSGLLGYGNLVIIKHDDVFLSAYGHNSQLLVKEGDKVAIGQEIAKMGKSPKEGAMLHFEIRKEGKPVDPSIFLPKKN